MTYRNWDRAQSQTSYKRRYEASLQALAQVIHENRVRDECLELAMEALRYCGHLGLAIPKKALAEINACLTELEPEEEQDA